MTKTEVIASVAGDLYATEQALDAAIANATTLVQAMIGSRTTLNISAVAGAEAQTKAMAAIAGLAAARQSLIECHNELAKDHRRLGYGTFAGPFRDKGVDEDDVKPTGRLRAV
ncbi:MAG TPA: hypothetical protein VLJ13_03220 [Brevundimonas sp.]|nr:hypothetical protein [Brevundimonas sp.]